MSARPAEVAPLTVWPPARRRLAAAAGTCAVATGVAAALLGDDGLTVLLALAHVGAALWAVTDARSVGAQVATGVALAWSLVPGTGGPVVGVVVVVAGVVATSELLGSAARLGMVVERDPAPEVRRVGTASLVALAASATTLAAALLAGPSGLVATVVAGLGCALLAVAVRDSGGDPRPALGGRRIGDRQGTGGGAGRGGQR